MVTIWLSTMAIGSGGHLVNKLEKVRYKNNKQNRFSLSRLFTQESYLIQRCVLRGGNDFEYRRVAELIWILVWARGDFFGDFPYKCFI